MHVETGVALIIHSLNNQAITSVEQLRAAMKSIKTGQAVVLEIERDGGMDFISFRESSL